MKKSHNISKKISIIIGFIIIVLIILCLFFEDDMIPYENGKNEEVIKLKSNIYNIKNVKEEIEDRVKKYNKNITLQKAIYEFIDEECNGKLILEYAYGDDKKNLVTKVLVTIDMSQNSIICIEYEKGHSKRISGSIDSNIQNVENVQVTDIYKEYLKRYKENYKNRAFKKIHIEYFREKIYIETYFADNEYIEEIYK